MRERVNIVGAGVAGLTAAHELVERGFEVHVYERRERIAFGGKAASVSTADGRPGEHGFRFFPGWYKHLPDTLRRIPYQGTNHLVYEGKTVLDNLVAIDAGLLAWYDRDPVAIPMHLPRSLGQAVTALSFASALRELGLSPGEMTFFARRMLEFISMTEAQRVEQLDKITWWEFLQANEKSQSYRDLIGATTRTMVAAKATEASALTVGRLAIRTFFDALGNVDRVLNGPTNDVWINPWVDHLERRGVLFHPGCELNTIDFEPALAGRSGRVPQGKELGAQIQSLSFGRVIVQHLRRLRRLLTSMRHEIKTVRDLDKYAPALAPNSRKRKREDELALKRIAKQYEQDRKSALELIAIIDQSDEWTRFASQAPEIAPIGTPAVVLKKLALALESTPRQAASRSWADALGLIDPKLLEAADLAIGHAEASEFAAPKTAIGDFFVFALPVEQLAYYVNRSPTLSYHDPSLLRIIELTDYTDWMAGIQFYLRQPVDIGQGHLVCMDSEWGLTAIEQTQFWREHHPGLDAKATRHASQPAVQAILSVDIADWNRKGRFIKKEAFNCTAPEVAFEVWSQLQHALNRSSRPERLRDDMLLDGKPLSPTGGLSCSFHLDESIADRFDRKKQAAYENARSVLFTTGQRRLGSRNAGKDRWYMWGPRRSFNVEPLLVNRVGARALRPSAHTQIVNLFLAADYVRTETDLACMEGANEAARHAVNALLRASSSTHQPCETWRFAIAEDAVSRFAGVAGMTDGLRVATATTHAISGLAGGFLGLANQMRDVLPRRTR